MAEGKKSFVAYADWIETFDELSDEEAGRLVKHLFRYVNDLNPEGADKLTKMVFIPIKQSLKRDLKKYETYIHKQKANGKKGGRPKNPTLLEKTQPFILKPKKADSVSVSVNVSNTLYSESHFLIDWNKCRVHYLKKPSNINKLKTMERSDFNRATSEFSGEEIKNALHGLFKQEVINFDSMVLRPKHFLERVTDYLDAHNTKSYKMYGSKPKEIQY